MSDNPSILRIDGASTLKIGQSRVFALPDSEDQGFLIGTPSGLRAFRNRCRHWPAPLDMEDGEFWNEELGMIQCKIHGAVYRGEDGLCLAGPCPGAHLETWPVRVEGDDVLVEFSPSRP